MSKKITKLRRTSMWTKFMDMHSGGEQKEKWDYIYIEAPAEEARIIFYNRFGHNSKRVTCTCCGEDYSVTESRDLKQATGYERGCEYLKEKYVEKLRKDVNYQTLDKYKKQENVLIIYAKDIKPKEKIGDVPEQGYVWQN